MTESGYYESAQSDINTEDYDLAIRKFQELDSRYPFGRYADQAQLELVYAYYQNGEYEAAEASAERFIRLHPNHSNVDYAHYLKALSSFQQGKGFIERFVALDLSKRDLTPAKRSFNEFSELVNRFPNSEYAPDARARMVYLRNLIAQSEIHVADYYMRRKAYVAAINRGRYVVENYQETDSVPNGLAIMTEGYYILGLNDLAEKSLELLRLNYPEHPSLESGEFNFKYAEIKDKSWWNILTFGLVK